MTIRVINLKHEPCDIRVCRPSRWGNPWRVDGDDELRRFAVAHYRQWIAGRPELVDQLYRRIRARYPDGLIRPVRLGCWCAPLPCHADVLAALLRERLK